MTTSNDQNISTKKRLAEVGKTVILFLILGIGMAYILLSFDLTYILVAIFAILAFVIAFFVIRKHLLIYSISALIIAFLFTASSFVMVYSSYARAVSSLTRVAINQVGVGLFCIGVGLFLVIVTRVMSDMNNSDFWASKYNIKSKYPMFSIIALFVIGLVVIMQGIYLIGNGLYYL